MLVKNWFHLGPVGAANGEWEQLFFENEYHSIDPQVLPPSPETLQLLAGLPRRARRDAFRTLRGTALRTESYAVDGSNRQFKPYTVSETRPGLQLKDHPGNNPIIKMLATQRHSNHIFFSFTDGSRTTQWERGDDPMVSFSFSGDFDDYGQPRRALSAALPRGIMPPYTDATNINIEAQEGGGEILATLSLTDYVDPLPETNPPYIKDRVCRTMTFEINPSSLNVFELRDALMPDTVDIAIDTPTQSIGALGLEVIGCQLNYYDGIAFTGLPFGKIGDYGAMVRSETLVLTDTIISAVYDDTPEFFKDTTPDLSAYPQGFQDNLQNDDVRLGYNKFELPQPPEQGYKPEGWYAPGAKTKYDFQDGGNTNPRGLVEETRDAFDNRSTVQYDDYKMMPVSSQQYLDGTNYLETSADYDYRILQPWMVTDPNGNRSVFGFSPLGLLMKSGVIGKVDANEGDIITETPFVWKPSVRMEYDFLAWYDEQKPVWVKTIQNEQHYQDDNDSPTIAKVEFSDGFGRLLQTRAQAEDVIFGATAADRIFGDSGLPADQADPNANAEGTERGAEDPLNVVVSGWQVYDNKGRVVEQYEPFFSQGLDDYTPVEESQEGEKLTMYYDSAGRVVRTVNPDGSEQRLIVGVPPNLTNPNVFDPSPWHHHAYDANDLADITNLVNDNVADSHKYTPKSEIVDALGRTIKTTEHEAASDNGQNPVFVDVVMKYEYDIRGNLVKVTDALGRVAFEYKYDLKPTSGEGEEQKGANVLWVDHIDSGTKHNIVDASFKPIQSDDEKDAHSLNAYDRLSRPIFIWTRDNTGESIDLRQKLVYGDDPNNGPSNPETTNHRGKLYEHYDEAGLLTLNAYDFKGNVLQKTREVIADSEILSVFGSGSVSAVDCYRADWDTSPQLEGNYQTDIEYDALNRVTQMKYPEDTDQERKELSPTYNRAGALESVVFDGTTYVDHIAYNARGQRLMIALGNSIMTRYAYDNKTFRLARIRSEKYDKINWEYSPDGNLKQDTAYFYDLAGNIISTNNESPNSGVGGSASLEREFSYDPLYRLLTATGRENAPTITPIWDDRYRSDDHTLTTAYMQKYNYDKMGNILRLKHTGNNDFTRIFNPDSGNMPADYGNQNLLNEVKIGSTTYSFQYDLNGNLIQENADRFYEWDAADQMRCFFIDDGSTITKHAHYLYDAAGNRVKKLVRVDGGNYTSNTYIDGVFERKTDGTDEQNTLHIMDDASRIALLRLGDVMGDSTPPVKYILENHLGSSVMELKDDGQNISKEEYYPFGETSFGSHAFKRYKYNGKERDGESGLYYYGARYYSAWCCRFISVDGMAFTYNQLTPYQNAGNNPIGDRDIDGNQSEKTPEGAGNNQNNNSNNQNKTGNNSKVLKNKNIHKAEVKTQFEGEYGRDYMEISNDVAGSANDDGYINTYTPGFVKKVFWNPDFKEGEQQGSYFVQRSKVPQRVSISRIEPKSYTYAIERPQIIKPQSTAPPSLSRPEKVPHLPLNENIVVPVPILTDGTLIVNSLDNSVVALDNLIETIKAMGNTINSITINSQIGEGRGRFEGQYNQNAFQNISTYISNQLPNLQIKRGWVGSARGENRISGLSKPISVRINSPN